MSNKIYPIGIQNFEKIRQDGYFYVDKTALMYQMVKTGSYYFLSRPRRFGKSLLISTLEAYFQGKKELFTGLMVEKLEKDWIEHPILHLDLNIEKYDALESLDNILDKSLTAWEKLYGAEPSERSFSLRFAGIIERACQKTGQRVVILVDEYDKPMLQAIGNEDLQKQFRDTLKPFYGALKTMDGCIKFALLTGVTKFGKVSVFSDLNNLKDISMDDAFPTFIICLEIQHESDAGGASLILLHIHHVAVVIGINIDAALQRDIVGAVILVILVGFTVGHKLGVSGFGGDFLILDLLRHGHGLDVAVGHGIEHHVILIKGGVGLKLTTVAGQAGDLDVGLLVLFHAVSVDHLGNLTHIGVDNHEGHVVIAVHKSLDQNAVAAGLQLGVVALLHGEVGGGLTVHNHVGLGGLAQAQVGVDGLGLDFLGVGGIGGGSIGADLLGAVLPLLRGTAEVIAAIIVHRQIGEILLAELLHLVTVGGNGAVVVGLAVGDLHRGGGAHNNLSAVGSVDGGALVGVVHHVGGQGLERHLGGLLTGHGVGQHDALGGDARVHRVGGHVDPA